MIPASNNGGGTCFAFPDVCKTPVGPSVVPLPYPNVSQNSSITSGTAAKKVKICKKKAAMVSTKTSMSSGDEPGSAGGGVVSGSQKHEAEFITGYNKVKIEGKVAAMFGSVTKQNKGNIVGAQIAPSQTKVLYSPIPNPPVSISSTLATDGKSKALGFLEVSKVEADKPAHIVKVEFLDGNETTYAGPNTPQWVNLPRKQGPWVDGSDIPNIDRLGTSPRILVEFDRPGEHQFSIRLKPGSKNHSYSNDEQSRHKAYKVSDFMQTQVRRTRQDGRLIIDDMPISCGAWDTWSIEADDEQGKQVTSSGSLRVERKVFIQHIKMEGETGKAALSGLNLSKREIEKHGVAIQETGRCTIPEYTNIDSHNEQNFLTDVLTSFTQSSSYKLQPHCINVAYTGHLADKREEPLIVAQREVGGKSCTVEILDENEQRFLWNKIVEGEDWWESALWVEDNGETHEIDRSDCHLLLTTECPPDQTCFIEVDLSSVPKRPGTIHIVVNCVKEMSAGLSYGGVPIVCICTRAWWEPVTQTEQEQTAVHELGHQFRLTSNGIGDRLEEISTYYFTDQGHVGNHCHAGLAKKRTSERYDAPEDAASSTCVMYGATNGHISFCSECGPSLQRQDLSNGYGIIGKSRR